jgi:hypothetical protein
MVTMRQIEQKVTKARVAEVQELQVAEVQDRSKHWRRFDW